MTDDTRIGKSQLAAATGGLIAAGVAAAYFTAPLLGFADPEWLMFIGAAIAFVCIFGWGFAVLGWGKSALISSLVFALAAIGGLGFAICDAVNAVNRNDARCRAIETEMLSPKPRRDDLTDLFTALKCRPQTGVLLGIPPPSLEVSKTPTHSDQSRSPKPVTAGQ